MLEQSRKRLIYDTISSNFIFTVAVIDFVFIVQDYFALNYSFFIV